MTARRHIITALLACFAAGICAANALAASEPLVGTFTEASRERVRAQARAESEEDRAAVTEGGCVIEDTDPDHARGGSTADNDACHYARGSTIVVHVFADHDGGQWSGEERADAGAKAAEAKDFYRDYAPTIAYMTFDHEDNTAYYFYNVTLPYDINDYGYFETWMVDDCAQLIGFNDADGDGSRIDEMSIYLQGWGGGWDNAIIVFQPADFHFNPATASLSTSWCRVGVDHSWATWAHEWGHIYGACDEYSTADCNGIYCPDICQSWYLTDQVPNGNCELGPCGSSINCLMRWTWTGSTPCTYTHRNWGWVDANDNGLLDTTVRWDHVDEQLYDVRELYHNGWFIHTNTDWTMVANQRWNSWSAIGVRSRASSAYNMRVWGDVNRNHYLALSALPGGEVEFVVGDFNHNNLGQDFVELYNTGGNGQYVLSYESGTGIIYPDGVERNFSWDALNVVRCYEMPLIAGEQIQFQLDVDTAGLDLGMALFTSNGEEFYGGRSASMWEEDDWPAGISESYTFTVPETDVYGLVVWANNEADGNFSIQVGPSMYQLAEETPFTSALDLRLFSYQPTGPYWSVAAARPGESSNVRLQLYGDAGFQDLLATSGAYPNVEFIAADYGPGTSTDYLRVLRQSGVSFYTTEWEHGNDVISGFEVETWNAGHVAKVWDVYLEEGQQYMFRQYEGIFSPLDAGIYVMSSANGDRYIQRSGAAAGSNVSTYLGEWFTYTAPADDWYGVVMIGNDEDTTGDYSVGVGPRVSLTENVPATFDEELIWTDFETTAGSWGAVGVRSVPGDQSSMGLWDCESYSLGCFLTHDPVNGGVRVFAIDANHLAPGTFYARADREVGTGEQSVSFDNAPGNDIAFDDPDEIETADGAFEADEVVHAWDLVVAAAPVEVRVTVTPIDPDLDLGVYLFDSSNGTYTKAGSAAIEFANDAGPGTSEIVVFDAPVGEVYGLVVTNENGEPGDYRIEIRRSDNTVGVGDVAALPATLALRARGGTVTGGASAFDVDLPAAGRVELGVYDIQGRRVRTLLDGTLDGGTHAVTWDGRVDSGASSRAGVYFVRLVTANERRTLKLIRLE